MTAIRIASFIHIAWGIYLIFFGYRLPRPYGAFEPYLTILTPYQLGILFLSVACFAVLKNFINDKAPWWFRPSLTSPQQFTLLWGLFGGIVQALNEDFTDRAVLALGYVTAITIFHTIDVFHYWHNHLIQRMIRS